MTDDNKQCISRNFAVALLVAFVSLMAVGMTGCTEEPVAGNATAEPQQGLTATKLQVEAPQDPSTVAPVQDKGVLEKAGDMLEQAKSGTTATAKGATDWMQKKIGDAATASSESASDAMGWAQWLTQDWKNMQSWEYKTAVLETGSADDQLNQLGAEGWECFHVDSGTFYFKKPADSYLRHLPFKDFIKLIPLLQHAK